MAREYKQIDFTHDERRRFFEIAPTLGREMSLDPDEEINLPVQAKSENNRATCKVTGHFIARGEDCLIIFSTQKRDTVAFIRDHDVFTLLLEAGSFSTARRTYRRNRQLSKETAKQEEPRRESLPEYQNRGFCIQCGKEDIRPDSMSVAQFKKRRRCDECIAADRPMSLGTKRFCRNCGQPFMPTKVTQSVCGKH